MWIDEGLKKARGTPQTQQWNMESIFKDYRKEGAGTETGDQNLIWAYSASSAETVTGVPKKKATVGH